MFFVSRNFSEYVFPATILNVDDATVIYAGPFDLPMDAGLTFHVRLRPEHIIQLFSLLILKGSHDLDS